MGDDIPSKSSPPKLPARPTIGPAVPHAPAKPRIRGRDEQRQAFPFIVFELRAVDSAISSDMLCCLDALRWGRAALHTLIPDGDSRVRAIIDRWGLRWPHYK